MKRFDQANGLDTPLSGFARIHKCSGIFMYFNIWDVRISTFPEKSLNGPYDLCLFVCLINNFKMCELGGTRDEGKWSGNVPFPLKMFLNLTLNFLYKSRTLYKLYISKHTFTFYMCCVTTRRAVTRPRMMTTTLRR